PYERSSEASPRSWILDPAEFFPSKVIVARQISKSHNGVERIQRRAAVVQIEGVKESNTSPQRRRERREYAAKIPIYCHLQFRLPFCCRNSEDADSFSLLIEHRPHLNSFLHISTPGWCQLMATLLSFEGSIVKTFFRNSGDESSFARGSHCFQSV